MIFRRKKPSGGTNSENPPEEATVTVEGVALPLKATPRVPGADSTAKPLSVAPKMPTPLGRNDVPRRVIDIPNAPRRGERPSSATPAAGEGKKLIVGREICLNGHISACERLIVEGRVEAELTDCRTIEIAESGTFKGTAEVDSAEISGRFDGTLTVHEKLSIRSAGQVTGTVRYGRIEIEQGGEINGDVKSLATAADAPDRREGFGPGTTEEVASAAMTAGAGES